MYRFNYANRGNYRVDTRRFRWVAVVAVLGLTVVVGMFASALTLFERPGAPQVGQQAVITPRESGGADVDIYYNWQYPSLQNFWIPNADRITNLTAGPSTAEVVIERKQDLSATSAPNSAAQNSGAQNSAPQNPGANSGGYEVLIRPPGPGSIQGELHYTVDASSQSSALDALVVPSSGTTFVVADTKATALLRIYVAGFQLDDIECEVAARGAPSDTSCSLSETEPGLYQVDVAPRPGDSAIWVRAQRGAAVAGVSVAPLVQPGSYTEPTPWVGIAFPYVMFAIVVVWIWVAVRRGSNEYRDPAGHTVLLSDAKLYRVAKPTLDLPADIPPAFGRVLANERVTRMVALTYIADLIRRGVLASWFAAEDVVTISRGQQYAASSAFDRQNVDEMLADQDPRSLGGDSKSFNRTIAGINKRFADQVAELDWWRRGNPTSSRLWGIHPWVMVTLWVAIFITLGFASLFLNKPAQYFAAFGFGFAFVWIVCYPFVIYPLTPSLTVTGSKNLVAIESLRQGLQTVTHEQLQYFADADTLDAYCVWSVALNVAEVDTRLIELAERFPTDPRLQRALTISQCIRNRTRQAVGIDIVGVQCGNWFPPDPNRAGGFMT